MSSGDASTTLTFVSLYQRLLSPSIAQPALQSLLDDHKDHLLGVLQSVVAPKQSRQSSITYLRHSDAARAFPTPTTAEKVCIDSLETHFSIPRDQAANVIRDFLADNLSDKLDQILSANTNLTSIAPLHSLNSYWLRQSHAAFSLLFTLLCNTVTPSHHDRLTVLQRCATDFVTRNADRLKEAIVKAAVQVISSFADTSSNKSSLVMSHARWIMRLLFGLSLSLPLSIDDRQSILSAYCNVAERKQRFSAHFAATNRPRPSVSTLDGAEISVLFVATVNHANFIRRFTQVFSGTASSGVNDIATNTQDLIDDRTLQNLDNLYVKMRCDPSPESSMLALSWASLRQLHSSGHISRVDVGDSAANADASEHMSFAISNNAFMVIQNIVDDLSVSASIAPSVFRCFWDDLEAFFTAFPPRDFLPHQVSQLSVLATSLLQGMDKSTVKQLAKAIWQRESTAYHDNESAAHAFIGANAILRMASGVFPQTYRPLINLLASLTVDEDSAKDVLIFLCERLHTVAESAEAYQSAFNILDEDEHDILASVCQSDLGRAGEVNMNVEQLSKSLDMVRFTEDDIVFVQATVDIPADTYRPKIPAGSIGVADVSQTFVTWIMRWNGFGAVGRILHFLLTVFNDHENALRYKDDVLTELCLTAVDSLGLINRLFACVSTDVAKDYLYDTELVRLIATIAAEAADPGDRARSSWLTKSRQERLLISSTSCLVSISSCDPNRAHIALEVLELSKSSSPLRGAVSALTTATFPAIAAVTRIAYIASHSDVISLPLRGVLMASSPRADGLSHASWFGKDPTNISELLTGNIIPLWLTSSENSSAVIKSKSLHWLLPTCSLELFASNPNLILQSPVISALFSSVISASCTEVDDNDGYFDVIAGQAGSGSTTSKTETFLFPALRAALTACYIALRERNKCLMDIAEARGQHESTMDTSANTPRDHAKKSTEETTTFENTLLKPDITNALALLSSGLIRKLKGDEFYERCEHSSFGGFMSDKTNSDIYWMLCPDWKHRKKGSPEYWQHWIQCMSARCLALQFCCLFQTRRPTADEAIQVAWPSIQKSLLGQWRGGGEPIRNAYAHLIAEKKSVAHIELIVTVLTCGQRAVARSLLAPTSASFLKSPSENVKAGTKQELENKGDNKTEVIEAVLNCLRESQDEWSRTAEEVQIADADDDMSGYIEVGQACLRIVACVRFLRVAWESQNSKWFESCWKVLKVWEVLADLVRCKGSSSSSRQAPSFDFAQAIDYPEASVVSLRRLNQIEGPGWEGLRTMVQEMAVAVDVSACWKVIAADVLQIFSAEISYKTTALLKTPQLQNEKENNKNGTNLNKADGVSGAGKDMFPLEVFTEGVFAEFSSVFTEKWMHVLFKLSDHSNEASGALERRVSIRTLQDIPSDTEKKQISVEERCQELSNTLSSQVFSRHTLRPEEVIQFFDRGGDVTTRFGSDYCFDTARVLRFLNMAGRTVEEACDIMKDFSRINMDMTIQDVQAEIVRAFSAMSSAVVFADSFCPQPSALLSYSSPQFGGKVCRFLARYLLFISPMLTSSGHAVGVTSEISMLMASLSTRLSSDELDQPALTAVRFQSLSLPEYLSALNVVGQLCVVINDVMDSLDGIPLDQKLASERLDIVRWLLLTTAKLVQGAAFRSRNDLMRLSRSVMRILRESAKVQFVSAACSVALSSVLEQDVDGWMASLDSADVTTLVKSISSLSESATERSDNREIAANLLLIIAQGFFLQGSVDSHTRSFVIRQLAGGTVLSMLPPESDTIPTYDPSAESRNSVHILWSSCLRLAGVAILDAAESCKSGNNDAEIRDVLEFSCASLARIGRDSLNLSADWPSSNAQNQYMSEANRNDQPNCISIAKVEEAELCAITLFRLSGYAFHLRSVIPDGLRTVVAELIRYADHALRLLRAEPVERWVRPVTCRERERSYLLHGEQRDSHGNLISLAASSPWSTNSPGRNAQTPGSPTPVRRSPMQALRAAIGDGSERGSPVPPSPGFTPSSPSVGMPSSGGQMLSSPLSPWIPYGAGLISETGLYFGEEVSRSLLRGLAAALAALRRFASEMEVPLFSTSLVTFDDPPGLGSLINILHHAGGELQRGTDEVRQGLLLTIAENAFMLVVFHVMIYVQQNQLSQHVRDELRKRIPTYILRMRRCVPPPPSTSVLSAVEIDRLWEQLR